MKRGRPRRYPIVTAPLPSEAMTSWLSRLGARYGLTAHLMIKTLLREEIVSRQMSEWADWLPWNALDEQMMTVAGLDRVQLTLLRGPGAHKRCPSAWARHETVWCPFCVAADLEAHDEIYIRRDWRHGATVICPIHQCLLTSTCPKCCSTARPIAWLGRLRLWCSGCATTLDKVLRARRIPMWPYNAPDQIGRCRNISFGPDAVTELLRIQSDVMTTYCGDLSVLPWDPGEDPMRGLERLRRLCHELTRVVGEANWISARQRPFYQDLNAWQAQWGLGALPVPVAAVLLLITAAVLSPEPYPVDAVRWIVAKVSSHVALRPVTADTLLMQMGFDPVRTRYGDRPVKAETIFALLFFRE